MSLCPTCGADLCVNPSFCAACRDADHCKARGEQPRYLAPSAWTERPTRVPRDWDSMSLDALWQLFNSHRPTPQSTVEAIMHCVRERGPKTLYEPMNIERLSRCDASALAQIDARIAKLKRGRQ
jgi:hypothetical protein